MAPSLTSTGLQIDSLTTVVSSMTGDFMSVYGSGINVGPSTPDGQIINIWGQTNIDVQEWQLQSFTSFDYTQAVGVVLDQRGAIIGIQREMGTYTQTNIQITVSQTVTLYGQDQLANTPYTVTDTSGSMNWELLFTTTIAAGTYQLAFDAATIGPVLTVPGTISIPVSVVLGVTSINNNQPYTSLGTAQETDMQFKIRAGQSKGIGSQGYYGALFAQLSNIAGVGVGNVVIYENDTATTSTGTAPPGVPSGIPSHSIWVIVGGGAASESTIGGVSGANAQAIATAIYNKRNSGCGMLGTQSYAVTRPDGTLQPFYWDVVAGVAPFIKFTVGSINGSAFPNLAAMYTQLPELYLPGINQLLTINQLITYLNQIDPNSYISSAGFSTTVGGSYTATLTPAAGDDQFQIVSANMVVLPMLMTSPTSVISIATGIPLTSNFTVTNNATSGYNFTVTSANATNAATYTDANGNTYTVHGTISSGTTLRCAKTGGSAATPASGTLTKATGSGDATIAFSSVVTPTTLNFTGLGGYQGGGLTYTVSTNNSGATINASTGVYIAGPTPASDVVTVTDTLSNTATVTVIVA